VTLGPEQKEMVRSTWAMVVPISDDAAKLFYGRLFEIDPSTQPLFAETDMAEQGKKLIQTLDVAVASLDNLENVRPAIEALGRRHVEYGVKEEHYDTGGEALLWTLEQGLGERFTPEVKEAWAETYGLVTTLMKDAAYQSSPTEGHVEPDRVGPADTQGPSERRPWYRRLFGG
jgi:hemoglobin-like flavoprotein